ncbi:MAG: thioesterase family protein [bacterium]
MTEIKYLREILTTIFNEHVPFNKHLGMKVEFLDMEKAQIRVDMRPELVGNFMQKILHGGVISASLDVMGGLAAFLKVLKNMEDATDEEKIQKFSRFGTLDLRIDFLRPGRGKFFIASASVLRAGNKVAVTKMELHNDAGLLIAVATGTYVVV